jgi:hypothetical protein
VRYTVKPGQERVNEKPVQAAAADLIGSYRLFGN